MEEFILMLRNVLVFVALAIPGYILVKLKFLKSEQSGVLSKLLMYVGMPFLIFVKTAEDISFNVDFLKAFFFALGVGVVVVLAMFFASKPLTKMEKEQRTRGVMRFASMFANNGFLGIPLAMAVFGDDSPAVVMLIVFNIVTNLMMYTLGVYLITGDRKMMSVKKAVLNPVLIAFLIGVVCNLISAADHVPEVGKFSHEFSNIVTPISMTIIGMKMGGVKLLALFKGWKMYYVSALKLLVFPVLIVGVLLVVRTFASDLASKALILGAFISFATPTAGLASAFSDIYDGDVESAVSFTLGSTIFSVVTIPVLYWLLCVLL